MKIDQRSKKKELKTAGTRGQEQKVAWVQESEVYLKEKSS